MSFRIRFYLLYLVGFMSVLVQRMLHLAQQGSGSGKRISLAELCNRQGFTFLSSRLRDRFETKLHRLLLALQSRHDGRSLHRSSLYAMRQSGESEEYVFHQNYPYGSGSRVEHISGFYCNCPLRGYPEMLVLPRNSHYRPPKQALKGSRWHEAGTTRSFRLYLRGTSKAPLFVSKLLDRIEESSPPRYAVLAGKGLLVINQQVKDTPDGSFDYEELVETGRSIAHALSHETPQAPGIPSYGTSVSS